MEAYGSTVLSLHHLWFSSGLCFAPIPRNRSVPRNCCAALQEKDSFWERLVSEDGRPFQSCWHDNCHLTIPVWWKMGCYCLIVLFALKIAVFAHRRSFVAITEIRQMHIPRGFDVFVIVWNPRQQSNVIPHSVSCRSPFLFKIIIILTTCHSCAPLCFEA